MTVLSSALERLLRLDGRPVPDSPTRDAMLAATCASRWLRFALGLGPDEAPPDADIDAALADAADEFAAAWQTWMGFRRCVIELRPPATTPVRFRIDAPDGTPPPPSFPASTLAVITAWNPRGEPRPHARANREANVRLAAMLDARMVERWPATNAPGTRFAEESFAVLGLDRDEAWRIGDSFQQLAIYYVERGVPLLVARRRGHVVAWAGTLASA